MILRYVWVCLFMAGMLVPLAAIEWTFGATGSGLSLFDTRGAGQVTLLLSILVMVLAYWRYVAGGDPAALFSRYLHQWRRASRGFWSVYLVLTIVIVLIYLGLAAAGRMGFSQEAWDAFGYKTLERTIVGVLGVVVLATTEEIMFRVFLMRHLRWNESGPVTAAAIVFSSFVFAASHNLTDPLAWLTPEQMPLFVGLFVFGAAHAVVYIATGSFWCNIGMHTALLGSKVVLRKTELFPLDESGWLLGGREDIRAAPLVWALFALIALVAWLNRARLRRAFAVEERVVDGAERV